MIVVCRSGLFWRTERLERVFHVVWLVGRDGWLWLWWCVLLWSSCCYCGSWLSRRCRLLKLRRTCSLFFCFLLCRGNKQRKNKLWTVAVVIKWAANKRETMLYVNVKQTIATFNSCMSVLVQLLPIRSCIRFQALQSWPIIGENVIMAPWDIYCIARRATKWYSGDAHRWGAILTQSARNQQEQKQTTTINNNKNNNGRANIRWPDEESHRDEKETKVSSPCQLLPSWQCQWIQVGQDQCKHFVLVLFKFLQFFILFPQQARRRYKMYW